MASLTATADPTTGSVLIELDRVVARDSFSRAVVDSWGDAPPLTLPYSEVGGAAADYDVNGTQGLQTSNPGTAHSAQIAGPVAVTMDGQFTIPVNPSGDVTDVSMLSRGLGGTYFLYRVRVNPGGPVSVRIGLATGATLTPISNSVDITYTVGASNPISIFVEDDGINLRMKAWRTTAAPPDIWTITSLAPPRDPGTVGMHSFSGGSNTNGAFNYVFDNLRVLAGVAPLDLYRVTPDGTETLVRGSGFDTQYPEGTAVIWDNESPFDVNVFYVLRSRGNPTLDVLTSNTVNLASGGDVWLRDPYDPSKNLIIEISEVPFDYCDETPRIMFADLQSNVYDSASGIFEIINTQRPQTIAQARKRYGSTLYLTSKEAEDVDAIETIIAGGYPLLLSLPPVYQLGRPYGTDWVTFLTIQSDPPGVDRRLPTRNWVMPFRLSPPAADIDQGNTNGNGIAGGGASYDDLAASALGLTYNSLNAAATTYNAVAAGTGY